MGTVFTVFDSCKANDATPASYMEQVAQRRARRRGIIGKKDKVDVVGVAIESALTDIRNLIGAVNSDDEMVTE
jgi:hypothetical protein